MPRCTILLVEDEAVIAMAQKVELERCEYRVLLAADGEEAVRVLTENPGIDLVLMDVDLGRGMDGIETGRRSLALRDVPVVFLSGHTEPDIVRKTESVTSYGYVVKSSGITVLDTSIKMALRLFSAKRELEAKDAVLRQSELRYRSLFTHTSSGVALHEMEFDDAGRPRDYRFLDVNPAFERMVGRPAADLVGRTVLEVMPATESYWIETYGEVVLTGKPRSFIQYSRSLGRSFDVRAFSLGGSRFAVVCVDIQERAPLDEYRDRNERRLEALIEVLRRNDVPLRDYLDYSLEKAIEITQSRIGYIYLYDESTRQFSLNSWSREVMPACTVAEPQTRYDLEKTGVWGEAVRQRRPVVLNDFTAPNELKKGLPEGHVPLRRFLTVPVLHDGRIVAVLGLANKETDYDEMDVLQASLLMDGIFEKAEELRSNRERDRLLAALEIGERLNHSGYLERDWATGRGYWSRGACALLGVEDDRDNSYPEFLSKVHPEDRDRIHALFMECRDACGAAEAVFRIRRADGTEITVEGRIRGLTEGSTGHSTVQAVITDVTERIRKERERLRLAELVALANAGGEFRDVARRIFENAKELTGARAGYIALLNEKGDNNDVVYLDSGGSVCTVDPSLPMPIRGLRARAYERNEAVFDNDFASSPWQAYMPGGHMELRNVLFAPVILDGQTLGLIGLANKDGGFNEYDRKIAGEVGGIAAVALRQARYRDALKASLAEKDLLFRELQHRVKNNLVMAMGIVSLERSRTSEPAVRGTLAEVEGRLRSISSLYESLLVSPDSIRIDLRDYLGRMVKVLREGLLAGSPIRIDLECAEIRVSSKVALNVGLIAHELVSNAVKYAFPGRPDGRILVRLGRDGENLVLSVSDNGVGLPAEEEGRRDGMGSWILRALAAQIGGDLAYGGGPGTTASFSFRDAAGPALTPD